MLPADMLRMLQHISRLRSVYALLKITKDDCVKTYFSEENPALELVCAWAPGAPAVGLSVPFHGGGRGHGGWLQLPVPGGELDVPRNKLPAFLSQRCHSLLRLAQFPNLEKDGISFISHVRQNYETRSENQFSEYDDASWSLSQSQSKNIGLRSQMWPLTRNGEIHSLWLSHNPCVNPVLCIQPFLWTCHTRGLTCVTPCDNAPLSLARISASLPLIGRVRGCLCP